MPEYRFVTKAEYGPVREELEEIIKCVQHIMREKHKITFQFQLVGSGKRHLITELKGGNRGFDFDYNFIIRQHVKDSFKVADLKKYFMDALAQAIKKTLYEHPQDKTAAIKIKVVDRKSRKIKYSCDFAIIVYGKKDGKDGYYYLRNNKKSPNSYCFVFRPLDSRIEEKVKQICDYYKPMGWTKVQEEYLKVKRNNREDKPSFSLYIEAVNNVYNQLQIERRKKGRGK